MLNGLTLVRWGTLSNGSTNETDELPNAWSLKVTEMTHIGGVGQYNRIGSFRVAFQDQQRCDLHLLHKTQRLLYPLSVRSLSKRGEEMANETQGLYINL